MRASKFPEINEWLRHEQTPSEQRAMWKFAADTFGFRTRKHNKRRVRIVRVH